MRTVLMVLSTLGICDGRVDGNCISVGIISSKKRLGIDGDNVFTSVKYTPRGCAEGAVLSTFVVEKLPLQAGTGIGPRARPAAAIEIAVDHALHHAVSVQILPSMCSSASEMDHTPAAARSPSGVILVAEDCDGGEAGLTQATRDDQ